MDFKLPDLTLTIETARFGPFRFQLGVDTASISALLLRVNDAHQRLCNAPLSRFSKHLEQEVIVGSIFGTNSIEGGTLTEEETEEAITLPSKTTPNMEQRRALNLKAAYDLSCQTAVEQWRLDMSFILQLHALITHDLPHPYNHPGRLRDNPKEIITYIGDQAHGGRYKPPQYGGDIRLLLETLIYWENQLREHQVSALIRAPLVHYYYELIHPFWDGNGRVGRVLEATLLQQAGFTYAAFSQARYYYTQIDHYFTLFNHCRKAARKSPTPHTPFITFFLEGMLQSLNGLQDRVNQMISVSLFKHDLQQRYQEKIINARQYAIVTQVLAATPATPLSLKALRAAPWYLGLYTQLSNKTQQRDLAQLRQQQLIWQDHSGQLWPGINPQDPSPHNHKLPIKDHP